MSFNIVRGKQVHLNLQFVAMTNTKQGQIQDFQRGRGHYECQRREFSRGVWGHAPPQKFLKNCVSKMAISSILRQILYSSKTNFLLVNFAFVKKNPKGGGGVGFAAPPRLPPFESTTAKIESDCDCDVHLCWQSLDDF